mmetsp:Transcript_43490/g.114627  ORF Transcript_43490/g.114627 Transcript_43490/m.114627 type:complete len:681 (+) Transcript_43490:129-2171(+)
MERKVKAEAELEDVHSPQPMGSGKDVFGGLTVSWVTGYLKMEGCELRSTSTIGDLAQALAASDRTAMAVVDKDGRLLGLATVVDVMRAYVEGTPLEQHLADWLASAAARAPPQKLQRLLVQPSASLAEVAEKMVANAVAGDCACHHIVVQEDSGRFHGVVSSLDLVNGLCHYEMWRHHPLLQEDEAEPTLFVRHVMKQRDHIFTCTPKSTMKDAAKELLLTNQGSILILDDLGLSGIITQRDLVKAFAAGVSGSVTVDHWLYGQSPSVKDRIIDSGAKLVDAANLMTTRRLEHLVVCQPGETEVVGTLSSLDVLLRTRANTPLLRSMPLWLGPTVGEVLDSHHHLTHICPRGATLGEAAELLDNSGASSLIARIGAHGSNLGLLTENGLLRACVDGWSSKADVEDWMAATEFQHAAVPLHLQVPPSMPLTEAASLMLSAAEPGRTCHHLVVRALAGTWLGVFSALDIARAIQSLASELDIARTGATETPVGAIMKLEETMPKCRPTDSLGSALGTLDKFCQNAALVVDDAGEVLGLITPRCAIQAISIGFSMDRSVADWFAVRPAGEGPREVLINTPLKDAAAIMTAHVLHHLLVAEAPGARPVGVLSSLDLARGIVSANYHCPFLSLGWLQLFGASASFAQGPPSVALRATHKRRWSPTLEEGGDYSPLASCRRSRTEL